MSGRDLDEQQLFTRWQQLRDERAREQLIERFLPLARKLARRYAGREPFDDLLQVASVGLLKAIDRFDASRGSAFSSFAVPTILGELKRYFRDCGWFAHVPRSRQELALAVDEAQQDLLARTGTLPPVHELAEYLELESEQVLEALEAAAAHHATSLDAPAGSRDVPEVTLADTLGAEDERFELIEAALSISAAARELSDEERMVLALRFTRELTQRQIAARLGTSQMHVSRLLRRTFDRMRATIEAS